jgi:putative spermidine/putrescine transport system ATP-binding protein
VPADPGVHAVALVRPESVEVIADPDGAGRVLTASFLGPTSRVTVAMPGDVLVIAQVASARLPELTPGTAVRVDLQPVPVAVLT